MRCPSCKAENPPAAKFCIECGSPVKPRCMNCGSENPPQAKFCGECGTLLSLHALHAEAQNATATTTPAATDLAGRPLVDSRDVPEGSGRPSRRYLPTSRAQLK